MSKAVSRGSRAKDMAGTRVGRLVVLRRTEDVGRAMWLCLCDCGTTKAVHGAKLRRGATVSCGCYSRDRVTTHGASRTGKKTGTYRSWEKMKARCLCPTDNRYEYYGGRGITICQSWVESFESFLADMGERPPGTSLDRIDNSKGYEPANCRWATREQQMRNTRATKLCESDAAKIRELHAAGVPKIEIARRMAVSRRLVQFIIAGSSWKVAADAA